MPVELIQAKESAVLNSSSSSLMGFKIDNISGERKMLGHTQRVIQIHELQLTWIAPDQVTDHFIPSDLVAVHEIGPSRSVGPCTIPRASVCIFVLTCSTGRPTKVPTPG